MKKLLNFVANIPHDKLLHFIAGMLITALVAVVFAHFAPLAVTVTVVVGFAKEAYDEYSYGGWDWDDLLATIVGGVLMELIILML